MDRGRERRYDDRGGGRGGGGYGGGYRSGRSPPRRGHSSRLNDCSSIDSKADERPRSRSTRRRSPRDEYRDRQRSPPAREYNERPRSPPRRRSRSPYGRERSPIRSRHDAPTYRERSPGRGGRYQDDRDRYGRRDYQPRDGPRRFPMENNYRPGERARSPPRRAGHASHEQSPRSQPLSRRGSPPPPAERIRSPIRSSGYNDSRGDRGNYGGDLSPPHRRARSPPREPPAYRGRSPVPQDEPYREQSPPRQQDDDYLPDADYDKDPQAENHRDVAPTGPSYRGEPLPAESRYESYRESSRGGRHGSNSHRGHHEAGGSSRSGGPPAYENASQSSRWPASSHPQSQPRWEGRNTAPAFRGSSNSTSTTYPRTQRFNTGAHLSGVPSVVEGGKKQPSLMDPEHEKKIQQLEEEKRKLEAAIEEKQRKKRSDLRDWDRLEREAKSSQLRSELAEGHLERLSEIGTGISY